MDPHAPTREKAESELYSLYDHALSLLDTHSLILGAQILQGLLSNPLVASLNDFDFKLSIVLSLANANEALGRTDEALSLYFKASELKTHNDWNLWLKMALLCEKQGYFQQADLCYQECLKNTRALAFERVLYEKMVRTSFFNEDWESAMRRIDFLGKTAPLSEELTAIKLFILGKKGQKEEYDAILREIKTRKPTFEIEDSEVLRTLREIEEKRNKETQTRGKAPATGLGEPEGGEFVVTLEKPTWKNCLDFLGFAMKLLNMRTKGLALKSKHKKSKFRGFIEQIMSISIAETFISFKNQPKKSKKEVILEEKPPQIDLEDQNVMTEEKGMDIEEIGIEVPNEGFEAQQRGKSKRIQSIKGGDISIDEYLQGFAVKRGLDLEGRLSDFRENGLNNSFPNDTILLFNRLFKGFLLDNSIEAINEENNNNNIQLMRLGEPTKTTRKSDILKAEEDKNIKKASDEDFQEFLEKNHRFPTILSLVQSILSHFLMNYSSNNEATFSPHILLSNNELRSQLMKLYLQLWNFTHPTFNELETNLTLFELAFDCYLERKAKAKPQNQSKTERKLLILRQILGDISQMFLFQSFSKENRPEHEKILKIRTYHILTVYYTYKDFVALPLARTCLRLLRKELTEFLGKDPAEFSESRDFIALFWLNSKGLNSGFFELIEERILEERDAFAKMEVEVRKRKLRNYLDLFQERVALSFEDALDLYYRQILDFTLKPGLDTEGFLFSLYEILLVFHRVSSCRRSNTEELRRMIMKTIENLQLQALISTFLSILKERDQEIEDSNKLMDLGLLILKVLLGLIGFSAQESRETPIIIQELAQAFSSVLVHFSKKLLPLNSEVLIQGFSLLHFLIDLFNEPSSILHKAVFPLSLRTSFIRRLFLQYEKSSDDKLHEEIAQYFNCFYGINSPKRQENEGPLVSQEGIIASLSEIAFFIKYLVVIHEGYFSLNPPRFKSSIQNLLTSAFEFLKHNDDQWILCPRLESLVNEDLKSYLDTGDVQRLDGVFNSRLENQGSNCFCPQSCFPRDDATACLYSKGFFLMGKAFFEQQDLEKVKTRKSNLKKAEKMFQLNAALNPKDPVAWLYLGRVYREMAFMFADQTVYSVMGFKMEEFQGAGERVERVLKGLLLRIEREKGEEMRQARGTPASGLGIELEIEEELGKLMEVRGEAMDSLVILAILEQMQGKFKWVKGELTWKQYIQAQVLSFAKVEALGLEEENVRGVFLRETYVRRKNLSVFGAKNSVLLLKNLFRLKHLVVKQLIRDAEELKDESVLNEIEVETFITLWKFVKRYVKLLRFVDTLNFDGGIRKRYEGLLNRLKIESAKDLYGVIVRDCLNFLSQIKSLDSSIMDLADFIELEKELQAQKGLVDDGSLKLMLNTGELLAAGSEIESEKLMLMLGGVLEGYEELKETENSFINIKEMPLNRWINRFLECLLNRFNRLINRHSKKYRYYKHYVLLCYYAAKIHVFMRQPEEELPGGPILGDKALKVFDELFSIKTFELVEIYKKEKDATLCSLFHRELLFLFIKLKLLKMKSSLSLDRAPDLDKLRLLNNKIVKVMIKSLDGIEVLNEMLVLAYSLTLKDLIFAMKRILTAEKDQDLNILKWIDDLLFTVIRQKTVNTFLKEKQPELLKDFEAMMRLALKHFWKKEGKEDPITEDEEGTKEAYHYFFNLHNKKRTKSKKPGEEMGQDNAVEINIID